MRTKWAIALVVVTVMFLGAWKGLGQAPRGGRVSYEYLVMDDPTWTPNFVGAMKKLNELGAEGWELAGVSPSPNNPTKLYLKRVKK